QSRALRPKYYCQQLSGRSDIDIKCQAWRATPFPKLLISKKEHSPLESAWALLYALQLRNYGVHTRVRVRKADGFALIDLLFVCGRVGTLVSIAMPSLFTAKQQAGAASAIGSLRAINSAELTYALTCGAGFYADSLTRLGTAPPGSNEPFIGRGLGSA